MPLISGQHNGEPGHGGGEICLLIYIPLMVESHTFCHALSPVEWTPLISRWQWWTGSLVEGGE